MTTPAIEIQGLTLQVGEQVLFKDLTLSVAKGQKVVIAGPSGSGKSTFLKCLLGFVLPSSGRVMIEGSELSADTVWSLRRSLAYVAQEPDLGAGKVQEILEQPFAYHANRTLTGNLQRMPEQVAQFHLPSGILNKDMASLSGGEKQRVALVSAALLGRSIYLLDEVTSALDSACKQAVLAFFLDNQDTTVVLVTHDPDVLQRADQVIGLDTLSET